MNGNLWRNAFFGAVALWIVEHLAGAMIGLPVLEKKMEDMDKVHQEILERLRNIESRPREAGPSRSHG